MMPSAISGATCLWTALVGTGACAGSSSSRMDIAIVSGDAQTAAPGQTVPQPLVVAVTDAQGMAAVGAQVSWGVISGGGTSSAQTTTTDAMGRAQTTYTLGFSLGSNRIAARLVGTSTRVTFAATASLLSGGWPNEPVGLTVLTDWAEDAVVGGGWRNAYPVSLAKGYVSIVRDGTARWSPPNVLQFFYPIGFPTGVAPATVYYDMAATKELYAGFWWKASNPWQDNAAGNKIAFMFAQSGDGQMFIMMNGVGAPRHLVVTTEFPGDNRNLWPNVSNPDVTLGVWHRIEWSAKYSTTGSSRDGIVQWWLDGVRVGSYTDVQLPGDAGFLDFQFSPTFGGTGPVKTENDYYWVDHVHVSGR